MHGHCVYSPIIDKNRWIERKNYDRAERGDYSDEYEKYIKFSVEKVCKIYQKLNKEKNALVLMHLLSKPFSFYLMRNTRDVISHALLRRGNRPKNNNNSNNTDSVLIKTR